MELSLTRGDRMFCGYCYMWLYIYVVTHMCLYICSHGICGFIYVVTAFVAIYIFTAYVAIYIYIYIYISVCSPTKQRSPASSNQHELKILISVNGRNFWTYMPASWIQYGLRKSDCRKSLHTMSYSLYCF